MFELSYILCGFFEWNIERFKNPFVISGLIVLLLGVLLLIFSNKIAYHITLKMKDANDQKLANMGIIFKVIAFVVVVIGALLAVLFV